VEPGRQGIAFTRGTEIALLNVEDGVVTWLTGGREPAWSPDGSTLVFAAGDGCSSPAPTDRIDDA
jgi:hypothetical protein